MQELTPICPYCKGWSKKVFGDSVYPHRKDLHTQKFYLCVNCDAYVGCHDDGRPYGTLATYHLRSLRSALHDAFDPLWKEGIFSSRTEAYRWLADTLAIDIRECHIGMFNEDQCVRAIELIELHYG